MTPEHINIIINAAKKFEFREPEAEEDPMKYVLDLYRHVTKRDLAAAHEIRVGRLQLDWTPEDIEMFKTFILKMKTPSDQLKSGITSFMGFDAAEHYEANDNGLMLLAKNEMDKFVEFRKEKPHAVPPVVIHILQTDGSIFSGFTSPEDRVAVVKYLAQVRPVIGYVVLIDTFRHTVDTENNTTTKLDVLIGHVGSRTLRRTLHRAYTIEADRVVFDNKDLSLEIDWHQSKERMEEDLYASIFALPLTTEKIS